MRFEGKRAVVTGGASGIGRATALRLAREGAEVLIGDLDEAGAGAVAAEGDGRIAARRCDVTDAESIRALLETADAAGGLDLLFNNAGAGGTPAPIDVVEPDDWDRTHTLLLRSAAMGLRYAAPLMAKRGGGAVVNTCSISAQGAGFAPTTYSVAKAGVLHLSKVAAADLAKHRIRVNAVVPGFIVTNIFTRHLEIPEASRGAANQLLLAAAADAQPIRRPGTAEDVAAAVCFLLSEDAGFITGAHLVVDGGMTVGGRQSWDPDMPTPFSALDALR
ncbi:MAG TPA: SDR family NAD(P)-dependent oxidoreductase [Sphingomonas sp.]